MSRPLAGSAVLVLGAGMVGVCTALELQARGAKVTLIDRRAPGRETSYGNAGVVARSSMVPLNNPGLWRELPALLGNRRAALRWDIGFVLRNLSWTARFLANARRRAFDATAAALDALICLSIDEHLRLLAQCRLEAHLSRRGWLHLYRSDEGFARGGRIRAKLGERGVDAAELSAAELRELEPALKPVFRHGLWIRGGCALDNPGAVVEGYARAFAERGGQIVAAEIVAAELGEDGARLLTADGATLGADQAVICLGPWGRDFLRRLGYRALMGFERGYHRHFSGPAPAAGNAALGRPVHDIAGGYVLAPMQPGLRLTTGVELCDRQAEPDYRQLALAEQAARQAVDLGEARDEKPWLGVRPTFPDSRPVIGALPGQRNLWVCFGHQHIGFSTGPGSARILADLMEGRAPPVPAEPFRPGRYIARI